MNPEEGASKPERETLVKLIEKKATHNCLQNLQPVQCDEKNKLPPVKLFEEYFVIGVDRNDIITFEEENPEYILYHSSEVADPSITQ